MKKEKSVRGMVAACAFVLLMVCVFNSQVLASETIIDVTFKAQVPPGSWSETNNCGQASALMVLCYHKGTTPIEQGIKDIDDWLYEKYGDPVNGYNGCETNTAKLEVLAKEYGRFPDSYKASGWNIERLKQEIDAGHPVIVAVTADYLSNRGYSYAGGHFIVAKGYDDAHIICNDPGTSAGNSKYYANGEFSAAMAAQGGAVVVVMSTGTTIWPSDPTVNLPICTAFSYSPQIVRDEAGGAIIIWQYSNPYIIYAQRVNSSGNVLWQQNGIPVCTAVTQNWHATISATVSDGAGGAIIVWGHWFEAVYAQHIDSNGNTLWQQDGVQISENSAGSLVEIARDGVGGALIVWEHRDGWNNRNVYAQRVDFNGNVLWLQNGVPVCTARKDQNNAQIVSDGAGGAIITWDDFRSGVGRHIYAQRVDSNGNIVWQQNGVPICTAENWQGYPKILHDSAGGAIITWRDSRSGESEDVYAQRVDSNGNILWQQNGVPICTAEGQQAVEQLISDSSGGAIIVWSNTPPYSEFDPLPVDSSGTDVYAQRVDSNGNVLWQQNGVPICSADKEQWIRGIVSDNYGGAIIIWEDRRSDEEGDIYAQRVDSSGNVLWQQNGVPVCTDEQRQCYSKIVSDDHGGAIVTWEDDRNANYGSIYAQNVNHDGTLGVGGTDTTPTCAIELQKNGIPINNINVGEIFDIYVGGSTDDQGITKVRFSSDDTQDGNPTGEWTDWYDWDTSSGDWNAANKMKSWSFATGGDKEVWAEVKDGDGQTSNCSANINANLLPNLPLYFTSLWVDSTIEWAEGQIGEAGWEYWCLRFVANAFNLVEHPPVPGLSGWLTAWDAANALERYDQGENGWLNAPRGALIFFGQTLHNCGHVGIYLGDGNMIHAWTDGVEEKPVSELATHYIGWAYPPENWFPDSIEAKLECPAELLVHDSQGRITGLVNGVAKNEIPYSGYSEDTVTVLSPSGSNEYEIVGTDVGSYNLAVTYVSEEKTNIFTATDIPTTTGATHEYTINWAALSQCGEGVTVQVDSDGDGTFEYTFSADNELTQEEFLSGTDGEPIPEFTTIAIPVAIVLGLIFIISRRKRKR